MRKRPTDGPPRIMITRNTDSDLWANLADLIQDDGYRVELADSSLLDVFNTLPEIQRVLEDVDFIVFTLSEEDLYSGENDIETIRERFAHKIGLVRGGMEMDGVVLLVEESISPIFKEAGIYEIPFDSHAIGMAAKQVVEAVQNYLGPKVQRHYIQKRFRDQIREPDTLIGFFMLFTVIMVGVACLSMLLGIRSDSDKQALANVETDSFSQNSDPASPIINEPLDSSENGSARSLQLASDSSSLPISCTITTLRNQLLSSNFVCEGSGRVEVQGDLGPWHNTTKFIILDPGVVAKVIYEGTDEEITLIGNSPEPTWIELDSEKSRFGVNEFSFNFTALNQKVIFYQSDTTQALLEFTLDS